MLRPWWQVVDVADMGRCHGFQEWGALQSYHVTKPAASLWGWMVVTYEGCSLGCWSTMLLRSLLVLGQGWRGVLRQSGPALQWGAADSHNHVPQVEIRTMSAQRQT